MIIKTSSYQIEIIDESTYSPGSTDNNRKYSKEYFLPDRMDANAKFGVILSDQDGMEQNSAFVAATWYDNPHENSAIIQDEVLYLAIGNQVCSLSLPELNLIWYQEVDPGSCIGIYFSAENRCLILHGEQNIARLSLDGDILWSVSGKDIFTEGFNLYADHIEAVDFNHERYHIDISNGKIMLI